MMDGWMMMNAPHSLTIRRRKPQWRTIIPSWSSVEYFLEEEEGEEEDEEDKVLLSAALRVSE